MDSADILGDDGDTTLCTGSKGLLPDGTSGLGFVERSHLGRAEHLSFLGAVALVPWLVGEVHTLCAPSPPCHSEQLWF